MQRSSTSEAASAATDGSETGSISPQGFPWGMLSTADCATLHTTHFPTGSFSNSDFVFRCVWANVRGQCCFICFVGCALLIKQVYLHLQLTTHFGLQQNLIQKWNDKFHNRWLVCKLIDTLTCVKGAAKKYHRRNVEKLFQWAETVTHKKSDMEKLEFELCTKM